MNERNISPKARHRREVIADVEMVLSYVTGALSVVIVWAFLRALGVM